MRDTEPDTMTMGNAHLRRCASSVVRHRRLTILTIAIATAVLASQALNLRIEVNPDEQLPQDHPYVAAFRNVQYLFGDKDLLVIALSPKSGNITDRDFLRALTDITSEIRQLPGCVRPLLQSLSSEATKDIRLTDDGFRVSPLLEALPGTQEDSSVLRSHLLNDPLFFRTLVSDDGTSVAIYATFQPTKELPGYVNILERVEDILTSANQDELFSYSLSGPVAIVAGLTTYASRALLLFPISLLVIGLIHLEAFRTWQAVILPLMTGLLSVTWALGFMGMFRIPLDPFNSTTPVLILAIGTGHAVQILQRYYEYLREGEVPGGAITNAISTTGTATIAASFIAAASFLSLTTFSTASMRRFGLFTAVGIASSLLIELTLIPALRASIKPTLAIDRGHGRAASLSRQLADWLTSPIGIRIILGVYCALVIACAALSFNVSTDSSFVRQFGDTHSIRRQDTFINQHFSGANVLILVVTAPPNATLATPTAMNAIRELEERIRRLPTVGHVTSVADILAKMHHVLDQAAPEPLPQTEALLNQYLFLYSLSGGDELSTVITPEYRSAKIVVLITEDSTARGSQLIATIRRIAAETLPSGSEFSVAGTIASNLALTEVMVHGKLLNICQVISITVVVSALVLRSLLGGFLVSLPLALAILVNFGAMALLKIPLDVGTAAVSAMAVGIGADYAIYFLFRLREEMENVGDYRAALQRTIETTGSAIVFVATAVGGGYAILCTAGYQLYVNLGLLIALAMATASTASIVVVPATIGALRNWEVRLSFLEPRGLGGNSASRKTSTRRHAGS